MNEQPQSSLSRREMLKVASASIVAGMTFSNDSIEAQNRRSCVAETDPLAIVDTHHHLWDLDVFELPWLGGAPETLKRSFVMSDYLAETAKHNVVKTVYMEVNVADSEKEKEADYVIDLCMKDDNPMAAAVIGGLPHTEAFASYARKYAQSPYIRGVRNVLHDPDRPKGMCLQETFVKNMKLMGELGLSFDLCMRPDEIGDGVELAKQCPDTRFVIDHCGNMPVQGAEDSVRTAWSEAMKKAADLDNVVCKISGIVVTAKDENWSPDDLAPNMNFCMKTFGDDRVFFGGDWPVCTLKSSFGRWADALKAIVSERSPEFQRKLFSENATRLYRLG